MKTRIFLIAMTATLSTLLAACGGDGGAFGSDRDRADGDGLDGPDRSVGITMPPKGTDEGTAWARIEPRSDLIGLRSSAIAEMLIDPDDDRTLLVRFWGGVTECYGATATVISQTPDEIVVMLEVGGVPFEGDEDQACIEIALAQEIAVPLDQPADGATLTPVEPDDADGYLGLSKDDAIGRAESEGRMWRIASEDGEQFILTMDYRPNRINFEVEAGFVTLAWMG